MRNISPFICVLLIVFSFAAKSEPIHLGSAEQLACKGEADFMVLISSESHGLLRTMRLINMPIQSGVAEESIEQVVTHCVRSTCAGKNILDNTPAWTGNFSLDLDTQIITIGNRSYQLSCLK